MLKALTPRQAAFVRAMFTRDSPGWLCATRAARIAGYAWPGKQGPRLMHVPSVRAALEEAFARANPAGAARAKR